MPLPQDSARPQSAERGGGGVPPRRAPVAHPRAPVPPIPPAPPVPYILWPRVHMWNKMSPEKLPMVGLVKENDHSSGGGGKLSEYKSSSSRKPANSHSPLLLFIDQRFLVAGIKFAFARLVLAISIPFSPPVFCAHNKIVFPCGESGGGMECCLCARRSGGAAAHAQNHDVVPNRTRIFLRIPKPQ